MFLFGKVQANDKKLESQKQVQQKFDKKYLKLLLKRDTIANVLITQREF